MKIIVTGGAGFIGSAVIRNLIENTKDEVLNLDNITNSQTYIAYSRLTNQ